MPTACDSFCVAAVNECRSMIYHKIAKHRYLMPKENPLLFILCTLQKCEILISCCIYMSYTENFGFLNFLPHITPLVLHSNTLETKA